MTRNVQNGFNSFERVKRTDRDTRSAICTQTLSNNGQERWLALTAYAFRTEAVHGQEGYTILRLPGQELHKDDGFPSETGDEKPAEQPAKEYVLWEVVHASDARF